MTCSPKRRLGTADTQGQNSAQNHPKSNVQNGGVKVLPRGDQDWLEFSIFVQNQAQKFRANFGTYFGNVFGTFL